MVFNTKMALAYRLSFPTSMTTTMLPLGRFRHIKRVGEFKGREGFYVIENDGLFRKYIDTLMRVSSPHTLDREFPRNAGLGGAAPYVLDWAPRAILREQGYDEYELSQLDKRPEVPRATLSDDKGEFEILVEAYATGTSPACIGVYSTEPERALAFLCRHFDVPREFGPEPLRKK